MPTLVDTSDRPARDQADYWRHLIGRRTGGTLLGGRDRTGRLVGERLGGVPPSPSPEGAEMLRAIEEWIEARLHDPSLSPAAIAAAHHISVRQLYRVFQPTGTTVARYIRTRRLEHCRRELGDPFLGAQRIGAIAGRWGLRTPPPSAGRSAPPTGRPPASTAPAPPASGTAPSRRSRGKTSRTSRSREGEEEEPKRWRT
ncbi:helix-turn-helix domain-containing protein [Actinomadura sp. WMMA1423]|uniref:helix-turn-helix domain-containing protein n=1 Tax=Actinomadura sp. WMMA1423 TaxID=2591108 RepID=UPI001146F647|nr:helix-turn-helix domain-containing protein [Actinomadura sp. WMMA1423]